MSIDYAQMLIDRGGGMCCCGDGLGVVLGPSDVALNCPAGWLFVELGSVNAVELANYISHVKETGRRDWP